MLSPDKFKIKEITMAKKKDENSDKVSVQATIISEGLNLRAFIKLLRKDKTLADLDRLKVYNAEREPITQVSEISTGVIIS
jgi:hypothetical protein